MRAVSDKPLTALADPKSYLPRTSTTKTGGICSIYSGLSAQQNGLNIFPMYIFFFLCSLLFLGIGISIRKAIWFVPSRNIFYTALGAAIVDESGLLHDSDRYTRVAITLIIAATGLLGVTTLTRLFIDNTHYWLVIPRSVLFISGILILIDDLVANLIGILYD